MFITSDVTNLMYVDAEQARLAEQIIKDIERESKQSKFSNAMDVLYPKDEVKIGE